MCPLVTQGRGLSLSTGSNPICQHWRCFVSGIGVGASVITDTHIYTFRLWVISSANTASPSIYMLKIHRFIQHSPLLTPKNLLRPIQEWIKNCILVAFRDLDGSQQTEAQQRKTKLLLLHLIFRRCLTLDSLTLRNDTVYTSDHARNIGVVFDTIHWR